MHLWCECIAFLNNLFSEKKEMKLNKFKLDVKKNENGVWVNIDETCRLLVARAGNKNYNAMQQRLIEQGKKKFRNLADMPQAEQDEIVNTAIANTILLGWEGLEDENDKEIIYTTPKCIEVLNDPAYITFREMVIEIAQDNSKFRNDEIESVKENVKKS